MKNQILNFLKTNPNQEEIENFYCKYILPKTKKVIYHYHFSNLNDINKLIQQYK